MPPPEFPFTGENTLTYVFGQIPGLQLGFGVIPMVFLQYMSDDIGIPGEDHPCFGHDLYCKGIPVPAEILIMERQRVFQDTLPVSEHRPGRNLMYVGPWVRIGMAGFGLLFGEGFGVSGHRLLGI